MYARSADELYDLDCHLRSVDYGEHSYSRERLNAMRARRDELRPLVGKHLREMLDEER